MSIAAIGAKPSVAGAETVSGIKDECQSLGLAPFDHDGKGLEGQMRPSYTERVKAFTVHFGYRGGYNIYSAVAHAELAGLWRLFGQTGVEAGSGSPIYAPAPDAGATFAAADGALKAMVGPMQRVALLFGWPAPGLLAEVDETIDQINEVLARVRP